MEAQGCLAGRRAGRLRVGVPEPQWWPVAAQQLPQFVLQAAATSGRTSASTFPQPTAYAATLLLSQGVHPKIVQERLGHSQISVTMDTYSHVLPTMQIEAADKLGAAIAG